MRMSASMSGTGNRHPVSANGSNNKNDEERLTSSRPASGSATDDAAGAAHPSGPPVERSSRVSWRAGSKPAEGALSDPDLDRALDLGPLGTGNLVSEGAEDDSATDVRRGGFGKLKPRATFEGPEPAILSIRPSTPSPEVGTTARRSDRPSMPTSSRRRSQPPDTAVSTEVAAERSPDGDALSSSTTQPLGTIPSSTVVGEPDEAAARHEGRAVEAAPLEERPAPSAEREPERPVASPIPIEPAAPESGPRDGGAVQDVGRERLFRVSDPGDEDPIVAGHDIQDEAEPLEEPDATRRVVSLTPEQLARRMKLRRITTAVLSGAAIFVVLGALKLALQRPQYPTAAHANGSETQDNALAFAATGSSPIAETASPDTTERIAHGGPSLADPLVAAAQLAPSAERPSSSAVEPLAGSSEPVASSASMPSASPSNAPAGSSSIPDGVDPKKEALRLLNMGKYRDVIPMAEAAIARDPDDASSYLYLGAALQSSGRWKDGIEAYCRCVHNAKRGPVQECRAVGGH